MSVEYKDISDTVRVVTLDGRLDIVGTDAIATKFAALAASSGRKVIVDVSAVSFLASIGIRAIISNAKAAQQRGGHTFLFVGDNEQIAKTLETTGVDVLIPIFRVMADAEKAAAE